MTRKRAPKISSVGFYSHRFKRALRALQSRKFDALVAYAKLRERYSSATKLAIKQSLGFLIASAAFLASREEGFLQIKTALVSFSVPEVYLLFSASLIWATLCIQILFVVQYLCFVLIFQQHFGFWQNRLDMLVFIEGEEVDDFVAPPLYDSFLTPSAIVYYIRVGLYLGILALASVPIIYSLSEIVKSSLQNTLNPASQPLAFSLSICCLGLTLLPTIFVASAFIPFKTQRNTHHIRWLFLNKLHKKDHPNGLHPRIADWLG